MSAKIVKEPARPEMPMKAMYIGQIGTFMYGNKTVLALRTYEGLVDLDNPNNTWPLNIHGDLRAIVLPPGTIIEVEAQ